MSDPNALRRGVVQLAELAEALEPAVNNNIERSK